MRSAGSVALSPGDVEVVGYDAATPYPSVEVIAFTTIASGTTLYLTTNTMLANGTFTSGRFTMSIQLCVGRMRRLRAARRCC